MYGPAVGLGFHTDPYGEAFTPAVALSNLAVGIRRLHLYLNEWPIPALLPVAVWGLFARLRRRSDLIVGVGAAAVPALYFFYWHSGFYLGPRLYFLAVPWLLIALARSWRWFRARAGTRRLGPVALHPALVAGTAVLLLWSWGSLVPQRLRAYAASLPSMKLHPEQELAHAGVTRALVLVPESWGSRVVAGWWALGAGAGPVERAYRTADLCDLSHLLARARADGRGGGAAALESLLAVTAPGTAAPRVPGALDPTLRLRPERSGGLPIACARELLRDRDGFASYGAFAWRNAPALDRGLVFARDLFERDTLLATAYGGWPVWRLRPTRLTGRAEFILELVGTVPEVPRR